MYNHEQQGSEPFTNIPQQGHFAQGPGESIPVRKLALMWSTDPSLTDPLHTHSFVCDCGCLRWLFCGWAARRTAFRNVRLCTKDRALRMLPPGCSSSPCICSSVYTSLHPVRGHIFPSAGRFAYSSPQSRCTPSSSLTDLPISH